MGNCAQVKSKDVRQELRGSGQEVLHVIAVIFNPAGYNSRVKLYEKFAHGIFQQSKMGGGASILLWTVECLFPGQTQYTVTSSSNPHHIQIRAPHKLWLKENLINIAVGSLPRGWKYVAWVDADIIFEGTYIADRTISALRHTPVVQMYENIKFMGPNKEVLETNKSFGYFCKHTQDINPAHFDKAYPHPGFAWAMTRTAYNMINGLPDFSIVGNGDNHFAYAMIGRVKESVPECSWGYVSDGYRDLLYTLQSKLLDMQRTLAPNQPLGPGYIQKMTIRHMWHGDWRDRGYVTRWECLHVGNVLFNPMAHLLRERKNGLLVLLDQRFLRPVEGYFMSRKEDSKRVVTNHGNKHAGGASSGQRPRRGRRGSRGKQDSNGHFHDDRDHYDHDESRYYYDSGCPDSHGGHHGTDWDHGHCHNDHHDTGGHTSHDVFSAANNAYC